MPSLEFKNNDGCHGAPRRTIRMKVLPLLGLLRGTLSMPELPNHGAEPGARRLDQLRAIVTAT